MKTHGEYNDGFSSDLLKESLGLMTVEICLSSRSSFKFGSHPKSENVKEKLSSFLKYVKTGHISTRIWKVGRGRN